MAHRHLLVVQKHMELAWLYSRTVIYSSRKKESIFLNSFVLLKFEFTGN